MEIYLIAALVAITVLAFIAQRKGYEKLIATLKSSYEQQLQQTKEAYEQQLQHMKAAYDRQTATMKELNEEQVNSQFNLIREQMKTTSERVLKIRQEELGARNREQVSSIIDPLQRSLKDMQEALDRSKEQQTEALARLDEAIKINMQKSAAIGETADRLTRALTGEVKALRRTETEAAAGRPGTERR